MSLDKIDDLLKELSAIDSAVSPGLEEQVMQNIDGRSEIRYELKSAFLRSFQSTFAGLAVLILVCGPSSIISRLSDNLGMASSEPIVLADNFETESIVSDIIQQGAVTHKNDVKVLIELVDGATKQKEYVSGFLRVSSKSPGKASLILPRYEASVLKEYEKKTAL